MTMICQMTIESLRRAYADGGLTPATLLQQVRARAEDYHDRNIWIHLQSEAELQPYLDALGTMDFDASPLWGIPFAIKDNIDLAGIPTTAACPEFAYTPERSAFVVQRLLAAGAIPVGKTNLDQFATGLNGTRSPHGAARNAFDPAFISGGSSSGSALAVALGLASFSLGTDTAGSGRVPACFNNLVGVKPSIGLLSSSGMLPACRSLDCISIFALHADDANRVLAQAEGFDAQDGYSRMNPFNNSARHYGCRSGSLRIGVIPPGQLSFFGDREYQAAYLQTLDALREEELEWVEIDYGPFDEAARLLYEGPWVAERYLACQPLIDEQPEVIHPVVRAIIEPGAEPPATALFAARYRLQVLRQQCRAQLAGLDCLLTPTAGRLYTLAELEREPIKHNSELGYYTNFMNLLDMAAVALPTAFTPGGLPFGITLAGPCFSDRRLLSIANRIQQRLRLPLGIDARDPAAAATSYQPLATNPVADPDHIDLLVCGAHLQGLPLNWQLTERGASLVQKIRTAPCYRMYALAGGPPLRPGLVRDEQQGASIEVEIWRVPAGDLGSFVAGIPAPLGIGKVELADGDWVSGFICEPCGLAGAEEITHCGGWRNWLASQG